MDKEDGLEILQPIRNNLLILGVQLYQKHPFNLRNVVTCLMLSMGALLNCVHLFYEANTFKEFADSVCASSSMVVATITFIILVWKTRPIYQSINNLEELVTKRLECSASNGIYVGIDETIRKLDYFIGVTMMKFLFPCVMFSKFITSYFAYFTTDLGNDAFELPFPYWFPFYWRNPMGYLIAFTMQFLICMYLFILMASTSILGIGGYILVTVAIEDVKMNINSINEFVKLKCNRPHISKLLLDTVNFHSVVKQIVRDFSKITQPLFMVLIVWSVVMISGGMLMIRMQISRDANNLMILIVPVFELVAAIIIVFICCELSGRLSEQFEDVDRAMEQFKWYLFPLKMQQILPTILINAQQPVYLECFGSIPCDRETFKKVTNCGFSYFMVLREFGK